MTEAETKSFDQASVEVIEKATADQVNTAFDRAEAMKPCPIGAAGKGFFMIWQ